MVSVVSISSSIDPFFSLANILESIRVGQAEAHPKFSGPANIIFFLKFELSDFSNSPTRTPNSYSPCDSAWLNSTGMELKSLSSNWKKLQGTLKKKDVSATSAIETTKRKRSDREPQKNDIVKKRRVVAEGTGKRTLTTSGLVSRDRKKRMSQEVTNGGGEDVETVVKAAVSRVNEGRASKLVHLTFCYRGNSRGENESATNNV
jgi:hypothetical protein